MQPKEREGEGREKGCIHYLHVHIYVLHGTNFDIVQHEHRLVNLTMVKRKGE